MLLFLVAWDIEALYLFGKIIPTRIPYFISDNTILYILSKGKKRIRKEIKKLIKTYEISLILNIGIAGSINKYKTKKYEVYPISSVKYISSNKEFTLPMNLYSKFILTDKSPKKLLTVNYPLLSIKKSERKRLAEIADIVDMEFFHILYAAKEKNIPTISIKVISDTLEEITLPNIIKAITSLKNKTNLS